MVTAYCWPQWVQEAWAVVQKVVNPSYSPRCECANCWDSNLARDEERKRRAERTSWEVTPFSVPFQLDPTIVSEGMSASMLNSYYRDNWVSGETLT
jgi:hypothetical protein